MPAEARDAHLAADSSPQPVWLQLPVLCGSWWGQGVAVIQGFCQLDLDVDGSRGMPPIRIRGHHLLCLQREQVLAVQSGTKLLLALRYKGCYCRTPLYWSCADRPKELLCIKQGLSPAPATLRWTCACQGGALVSLKACIGDSSGGEVFGHTQSLPAACRSSPGARCKRMLLLQTDNPCEVRLQGSQLEHGARPPGSEGHAMLNDRLKTQFKQGPKQHRARVALALLKEKLAADIACC